MTREPHALAQTVANLDAWLDGLRVTAAEGRAGYGGPVVHWWQNCLAFTGPGLDWRYEGIIAGYLTLWRRTGQARWLEKAARAGDDLVRGQLPEGHFTASCFEMNPYSGGTPHEAAASLGLLLLAQALREGGDERWRRYANGAERNLRRGALARLWDERAGSFRDHPATPSLVPNKAATLAEALFVLAEITGDEELAARFALPALDAVLALQLAGPGDLAGGLPQDVQRGRVSPRFFPYYIARCVPALVRAHRLSGQDRYLEGAAAAMRFVARHLGRDGRLPQVVYRGCRSRRVNPFPAWIAPLGDVLRAAALLAPFGLEPRLPGLEMTLLAGRLPSGGIATAHGFAAQVAQREPGDAPPDFRDLLPVAGWCDKAFRYLAGLVPPDQPLPSPALAEHEADCLVRGRPARWRETASEMTLRRGDVLLYRARKGEPWAAFVAPVLLWK